MAGDDKRPSTSDSEAKLQSVLETAPDIILTVDRAGKILFINRTLPPTKADEVIGTQCFNYVPEESRARVAQAIEHVFTTRQIDEYEVQGPPGMDGRRIWTFVRAGPIMRGEEVVAVVMCATDISSRKDAEQAVLNLARGTSGKAGSDFFKSMVKYLAEGLRADYAFVGERLPGNPARVRTIASLAAGVITDNFEYDIKDTPCAHVLKEQLCFYPRDVQKKFPKDKLLVEMGAHGYIGAPLFDTAGAALGIIVALWKQPTEVIFSESILQVFSARAGAELERHRAEKELSLALQRLSLATASGKIGIWDWDVTANTMNWDSRMFELYGIRAQEFSGVLDAWEKGVHPDDQPRARGEVDAALAGTREFHTEFRVVWPDGQVRHIEGHGLVLRGPEGVARRMLGVNWDITARLQAALALRDMDERLRVAVSAANVGLWDWNLNTNQVFLSAEWKRQIGYDDHEVANTYDAWESRIHPDDIERIRNSLKDYLDKHHSSFQHEFRLRHKDGSYRWIFSQAKLIYDEKGRALRMLGSHVDVTERKLLEEQMRQAQKVESIGRLAGGVAHDFNNLLSAILGFTELARDSVPPDSSAAHSLARIVEAANRGGKLTQQLLAFARKKIVKPEVLNLNQVVISMENLLRRLIGEDLDLVLAPSAAPATVKVDRGSFEQVIMNLAVNARDAMPAGGKLTIETSQVELGTEYAASHADVQPGHYIMLAVSDTGTGIPEHNRAQIFEPFYTTKPIGQGTGLGLAMCHGIVKQAGGHIDVYSEVGKGTSFKIYLPLTEQTADAARPAYTPAPQKGGLETVLFVEDELLMLEIAQQFLSSLGYKFIGAKNGQEALAKVKTLQEPIHILVTDVIMPKMGGTELAAKMLELFPGIKVLYSSGYTDNAIVNHGILQENIHFLQKPYTPSVLAGKIRQVLDEKQEGLSKK